MDIINFYRQILAVGGYRANERGLISRVLSGSDELPATVDDKRLALPTPEILRSPDVANLTIFHPLIELTTRGESKVMEAYRTGINRRLSFIIGYTSIALLDLIISKDKHPRLTPDQIELMVNVQGVNEKTYNRMIAITKQMMVDDSSRSFAHIYVRRNVKLNGKPHQRAGIVSFPFYEEICKTPEKGTKNEVYGVTISHSDRAAMKALMEFLLPSIGQTEFYNRGSECHVAPTLEALLRTVAALYGDINSVIERYKDVVELDDLLFETEWEPVVTDLTAMLPQIRTIPAQPGNEGSERITAAVGQGAVINTGTSAAVKEEIKVPEKTDLNKFLPQPVPMEKVQQPAAVTPQLGISTTGYRRKLGDDPAQTAHASMRTLDSPMRPQQPQKVVQNQPIYQNVQGGQTLFGQQQTVVQPAPQVQQPPQTLDPAQFITKDGFDMGAYMAAQSRTTGGLFTGQAQRNPGASRSQFFSAITGNGMAVGNTVGRGSFSGF